jgi:hypothetical protein
MDGVPIKEVLKTIFLRWFFLQKVTDAKLLLKA